MRTPSISIGLLMVALHLTGCFSSASEIEFAGTRLGMSRADLEKTLNLKSCENMPISDADTYAGITGIHCQKPQANISEAELYFYAGNLYQSYFYFEGKLADLSKAYSAVAGKFGSHLKSGRFGSSNEGDKAVSSCFARLGAKTGCFTDIWIGKGFGMAFVSTYHERAVALIIQDSSHHAEIKSKYAEWDKTKQQEDRKTASALGF